MFAISTISTDADEIFVQVKAVIKTIVEKYGLDKVRYAVIVFGTTPKSALRLGNLVSNRKTLNRLLDVIPRQRSAGDLGKALKEAQKLFKMEGEIRLTEPGVLHGNRVNLCTMSAPVI